MKYLFSIAALILSASSLAQTAGPIDGLRDSQAIMNFAPTDAIVGDAPKTLAGTSTSGLAVTYASRTTAKCKIAGSVLSYVASGRCVLLASQAGNTKYMPGQKAVEFVISARVVVPPPALGVLVVTPAPTGNYVAGQPITFLASTTGDSITRVELHACGALVYSTRVPPWTIEFTPVAAGSCEIYAEVSSTLQPLWARSVPYNITITPAVVVPDPNVMVIKPTDSSVLPAGVETDVVVSATNLTLVGGELFACDTSIGTFVSSPYSAKYTPPASKTGCIIYAQASKVSSGFIKSAPINVVISDSSQTPWTDQNKFFALCQACPSTTKFETLRCPGYSIALLDPQGASLSANMRWLKN